MLYVRYCVDATTENGHDTENVVQNRWHDDEKSAMAEARAVAEDWGFPEDLTLRVVSVCLESDDDDWPDDHEFESSAARWTILDERPASEWITYYDHEIAFAKTDGTFDIVRQFQASSDDEANEYAEEHFPGEEWYVLRDNCNINGGKY